MRKKKERAPRRQGPSRTRLAELDGAPVAYIELNAGHEAIVDAEDLDRVMHAAGRRCWHLMTNFQGRRYAVVRARDENGRLYSLQLSKLILEPSRREAIIFENDNPLDCRKSNLSLTIRNGETARQRKPVAAPPGRRSAMNSVAIAKRVGKSHDDVKRDIRRMLSDLDEDIASKLSSYESLAGRIEKLFDLDHFHTEVLLAGYETKRRAELVRFWLDAEPPSGAR